MTEEDRIQSGSTDVSYTSWSEAARMSRVGFSVLGQSKVSKLKDYSTFPDKNQWCSRFLLLWTVLAPSGRPGSPAASVHRA